MGALQGLHIRSHPISNSSGIDPLLATRGLDQFSLMVCSSKGGLEAWYVAALAIGFGRALAWDFGSPRILGLLS